MSSHLCGVTKQEANSLFILLASDNEGDF